MKVVSLPQRRRAREERLIDLLARANHVLAEGFHAQVRARGLSVTEWRVLAALAERDGVPMMDLGQKVLFKQPTLTKVIDRMERTFLVSRRTAREDRRRALVDLTELGRQLATPLLASAREHEAWVARALGRAEYQKCRAVAAEIVDRFDEPNWRRNASHWAVSQTVAIK
jgi:MarR family transcriptional regulator, organic hydroperoxide resistance regulator